MNLTDFKTKTRKIITDGKNTNGLADLGAYYLTDADFSNEWLLACAKLNRIERDARMNLQDFNTLNITRTKVDFAFLEILKVLTEKDISPAPLNRHKILVVCQSETRKEDMKTTFTRTGLSGATFATRTAVLPEDAHFQLIIFDNEFLKENDRSTAGRARMGLMQAYFEAKVGGQLPITWFLHYGENNKIVTQNRTYCHAANSQFSLYARIMEMLDFISVYVPEA